MQREMRLVRARDFRQALHGRTRRGELVAVHVAFGSEATGGASRLGLAVTVRGGAVVRNRVKRRIRAAFRMSPVRPGQDVVVRADDRAASAAFSALRADLELALRGCGALEGKR